MKNAALWFVMILMLWCACAGLRLWQYWRHPARKAPTAEACVDIPEGSGLKKIALLLEEKGVIRHAALFTLFARLLNAEHRIQSGEYCLQLPLPPAAVLAKLVRGDVRMVRITIPEGSTVFDIARIVEHSGLAAAHEVVGTATDPDFVRSLGYDNESLEGYLFPDTYLFTRKVTPAALLRRMVQRFSEVVGRELRHNGNATSLPLRDIVILASLVEKETPQQSEKPLIAAVFFNRLRRGMRLECDPTVQYGVRLEDPQFQGRLRKHHLLKATPYNTYQIGGLPRGPICNPGLDAIRAVLQPAASDYLFFVSRNDGTHQFSRTLEEHNAAVQKYQRTRPQVVGSGN
ncbi:MAG: endolytic transglycosylase MltG [Desulfobacterota bacterium]|nr:endolytic transglycosylase MltG [Thermodesulfobacteriota bacterium]